MKIQFFRSVSLLAVATAAISAQAGLTGSTVNLKARFPDQSTVYADAGNAVVGAGLEYADGSLPGYFESFDFSDSLLTITSTSNLFYSSGSFNGYDVSVVSGMSITGASYVSGLAPVSISVVGGHLYLNYAGLPTSPGLTSVISITTGVPGPAAALPFALGLLRRRRRKA